MSDTLPKLLLENTRRSGDKVALRKKEFGIWQTLSWQQFLERVRNFSLGLVHLGLRPGDKVAIVGDNRPEWIIAELATQAAGGVSMGIYQDSVASEIQYLVDASDARFIVAEDQEQIDKILEISERLPEVRKVVYYDPRGLRSYRESILLPFAEVESIGVEEGRARPGLFEKNVESVRATDVAILSTTSGTTSRPKLAMLSHANLISMGRTLPVVDPMSPEDEFLSFLPLAWIGEQMFTVACGMCVGFTINFPEEPETVQENLREIGPHTMFSPPKIWENMVSRIQVKMDDASKLKRAIYDWAMSVGYRTADRRVGGDNVPFSMRWQYALADYLCFFWIKDKLGLRRLKRGYTGGAALGPDIFRFFHALGVNLKQIYGQTEVSGISVLHRDGDIRFQTVGVPTPGTEIRIADNAEILTKSPRVFGGYYKDAAATRKTLKGGWLYSGDAGYLDEAGHLVVIDRASDVMTLSDGTKFSPQFIENQLKFSPYIKEAVVFGGDRPFVTSIITIDYENAGKWAEKRQIPYTTFTDLTQKNPVGELVRRHVERMNAELPPPARIRRFLLLHKELDADDAELTRTRKVRRRFIAERYKELLSALYGERSSVTVETTISYQDGRTASIQTELKIETIEN
jgi:long-chain acyl-CoA synthetase